ncbi:MAG TPA: MFS transporter [Candidatus Limnocylindria bacterium]|jgi:MFS family permease|nr:MFS transporter [Candidatus Limnocylindria bacterium]
MHEMPATPTAADDRDQFGRPKARLATGQLLAVTAYWLAITVLWGAFTFSVIPRLVESPGVLGSATHPLAGLAIGLITTAGVLIAILVQPTVGSLSDETASRLGRRKPYILAGTFLDLAFLSLAAWAFWSQNYWAFVGAVVLLQFSSNFAQGPYQGYIPDLVPSSQVGIASGLLGAANIAGNLLGPGLAIIFVAVLPSALGFPEITLGLFVAIGAVELVTMLITVVFVPDRPAPPTTRTFRQRALGAWGTDLLANRDYVWLLVSRLFVLTALVSLQAFAVFFLETAHGMQPDEAQTAQFPIIVTVAVAALLSAVPGGWISSRIGRKPVLYVAIALGVVGAAVIAVGPEYWMVVAAAVPIGICSGVFLGVDWALMTDIIPKAESGRYMGISNIAVAGAGPIASTVGGIMVFAVTSAALGSAMAYRSIFVLMAVELVIGALALRRVREPVRAGAPAAEPAAA